MELRKAGSTDEDGKRESDTGVAESHDDAGSVEQTPVPASRKKRMRKGCGCLLICFGVVFVFLSGMPFLRVWLIGRPVDWARVVVDNLRLAVVSYYDEHGRLPGLGLNADGTFANTSQLAEGLSRVQTFVSFESTNWEESQVPAAWMSEYGEKHLVTNGNHFSRMIEVNAGDWFYSQWKGGSMPALLVSREPIQYRVDVCLSNSYLYAVGLFGGGGTGWPPEGTGYAEMERVDFAVDAKVILRWIRYKPVAEDPQQIVMVNAEEAKRYFGCESAEQALKMNLCWVGDTDALMSGDKAQVEKELKKLELSGWEF